MKKTSIILILLLSSTICRAEESDSMKACDLMATMSARAVQAKNKGADFVSFMDKVETLDIPADSKASLKFFVADAFANGVTPEHAYTKSFTECMSSQKGK